MEGEAFGCGHGLTTQRCAKRGAAMSRSGSAHSVHSHPSSVSSSRHSFAMRLSMEDAVSAARADASKRRQARAPCSKMWLHESALMKSLNTAATKDRPSYSFRSRFLSILNTPTETDVRMLMAASTSHFRSRDPYYPLRDRASLPTV